MGKVELTMKNFLELSGNLVYLRKIDKEFVEGYWESLRDTCTESIIFTGTQIVFNKSGVERYIDEISIDNTRVDFIIFSKETNEIVGEVVINDIYRNNRSANIRICIDKKENFSKGYGSEAMVLALNYGFGMLNLHRIELDVFEFNERAIHVYENIGFKREGIKRDGWFFNHKYYNAIVMGILEDEFRERYINTAQKSYEFL